MNLYNAVLENRHGLLVRGVAVILAPKANLGNLTGLYERQFPEEEAHVRFRYRVLRVWQLPVEPLLAGSLGTLPLAPISSVREADLPGVIARMRRRLDAEESRAERGKLWTAAGVLMGLRYERGLIDRLLKGVEGMRESVTYQAIVEEGRAEEARKFLLLQGTAQFGEPPPRVAEALNAIGDVDKLENLGIKLLRAAGWQDLLESAPPRPGRRRRQGR